MNNSILISRRLKRNVPAEVVKILRQFPVLRDELYQQYGAIELDQLDSKHRQRFIEEVLDFYDDYLIWQEEIKQENEMYEKYLDKLSSMDDPRGQ